MLVLNDTTFEEENVLAYWSFKWVLINWYLSEHVKQVILHCSGTNVIYAIQDMTQELKI
mgnify:CR=1 FL=1